MIHRTVSTWIQCPLPTQQLKPNRWHYDNLVSTLHRQWNGSSTPLCPQLFYLYSYIHTHTHTHIYISHVPPRYLSCTSSLSLSWKSQSLMMDDRSYVTHPTSSLLQPRDMGTVVSRPRAGSAWRSHRFTVHLKPLLGGSLTKRPVRTTLSTNHSPPSSQDHLFPTHSSSSERGHTELTWSVCPANRRRGSYPRCSLLVPQGLCLLHRDFPEPSTW